ncbi:MAG: HAD family hydrolase [Treponema sp.]|jgi:putative hydrolase of the HAD superfamily|nr:HAD family hydrolase [Treponema sp.]
MRKNLDGVAFDLDGTLYPNYRLYVRLLPFLVSKLPLLAAMGKARTALRTEAAGEEAAGSLGKTGAGYDFYAAQARIMAESLKAESGSIQEKTERLIYRGWEPLFKKIRPCAYVRETLEALKAGGLRLGLLSDFPPETKVINMGLGGLWDIAICSESTGRLKPSPAPFLELIRRMELPPERILYVGNSLPYDIIGAAKTGMKTALFAPASKKRSLKGKADFVFSDYRQLRDFVLT